MLVVRKKDSVLEIAAYGYVTATLEQPYPLGTFDTAVYEQVVLDVLPADAVFLPAGSMTAGLGGVPSMEALFDSLPVEVQATFWPLRIAVVDLLKLNKKNVAIALVEGQTVSTELQSAKDQLLALLEDL